MATIPGGNTPGQRQSNMYKWNAAIVVWPSGTEEHKAIRKAYLTVIAYANSIELAGAAIEKFVKDSGLTSYMITDLNLAQNHPEKS